MGLPSGAFKWFVTELDDRARPVVVAPGSTYRGWRLRPGVVVDEAKLGRALSGLIMDDIDDAPVEDCSWIDAHADDLLLALAESSSVGEAARLAGVSVRTLQRYAPQLTGKPPLFWQRLARARRAAFAIRAGTPLCEVANDAGFFDQAHMTREFRRWFSVAPHQVRDHAPITAAVCESGFGTPANVS